LPNLLMPLVLLRNLRTLLALWQRVAPLRGKR